jgi:regulator of sigma E protease
MAQPPQPWEFRAKPAWQRLIIMLGGVTVNVLLGIFIYAMILFAWGEEYLPTQHVKYGITADSLGYKMGLRDGDMILSVNQQPVISINRVPYEVLINKAKTIEIERNGQQLSIPVSEDNLSEMIRTKAKLVAPRIPFEVDSVFPGSPGEKAGIKKNDHIIALNGVATPYFNDFVKAIEHHKNKTIAVTLLRGKDTITVNPVVSNDGVIEVAPYKNYDHYFDITTKTYSLAASFPAGIHKAYETFEGYLKQMKIIFTVKDAHKEIGGFMSMTKAMSTTWDWQNFWSFTAFVSIVLAIMNILPIPALDGGHVMFLLYEVITRRKPNEKFLEYAQYVGIFIVLSLLIYANGNDIVRWIHEL